MQVFKECSYLPYGYTVSINGYVKGISGRILKPIQSNSGYLYFNVSDRINGKRKKVSRFLHRALAFSFLPLIDGKTFVNHIDANKLNNEITNLEWCSISENMKHAYDLGLMKPPLNFLGKFGKDHNRSKGVRCIQTGIEYGSQLEAQRSLNLGGGSISWSIKHKKPIFGMNYEMIKPHFELL